VQCSGKRFEYEKKIIIRGPLYVGKLSLNL